MIIWFRTFFLLPIGWVQKDMNVYHASPVYCKFKIKENQEKQRKAHGKTLDVAKQGTFKQAVLSPTFILLSLWMAIGNLNVTFCAFTWGQFTRYVDVEEYKVGLRLIYSRIKAVGHLSEPFDSVFNTN